MKYLALDIGNVICNVDFTNFRNKLSKLLNISIDDVEYFLNRTQKLHDMGLTHISDELRDHFSIKSSAIVDELMGEWKNTISFNDVFLEILGTRIDILGRNNLSIALLSNIGFEHAELVKKNLALSIINQPIMFFSCEVGARKPSHLYYKTFLDMHPEFKGCLYIDDRKENLQIGNQFGFNSQWFALDGDFKGQDYHKRRDTIRSILDKI